MNKDALIGKIHDLVEPVACELGCELYNVEYVKENDNYYLRIYIDKEGGIALSDCEALSRRVSDILDVEDPITTAYYLEVSSPGLNRGLFKNEHFKRFEGRDVFVKLTGSIEGVKSVKGKLTEASDDYIIVTGEKEVKIPKDKIKSANIDGEI